MLIISIWSKLEKRYLKETNKMQEIISNKPCRKEHVCQITKIQEISFSIKVLKILPESSMKSVLAKGDLQINVWLSQNIASNKSYEDLYMRFADHAAEKSQES